ncbi:uncharacterized protein ACO6RY_03397 [Pungitius sinensis]
MVAAAGCDGRCRSHSRIQLETTVTDPTPAGGAAYRRQQQPQDILDPSLHHTSSPPSSPSPPNSFFLYCYILKIYRQRFGFTSYDTSVKGGGCVRDKAARRLG